MKIKRPASVLCAFLVVLMLAGCGNRTANTRPDDVKPSGSGQETPSPATLVTGIVSAVDGESMSLDLVRQEDASEADLTLVLNVDGAVYAVTDETVYIGIDAKTVVVLEDQGYTTAALKSVQKGDFLAVVLRDDTAVVILDRGPAEDYYTDADTQPDQTPGAPEDNGTAPSQNVPDSGEVKDYMITTDNLKVRSGPGTSYSVLGLLDTGARVTGTVTGGWLKFTYDGRTAYCSAEYIAVSTMPKGVPDSGETKTYTTTDKLTIRSGPGTSYAALGTLEKGTAVTGTVLGGWLKFTYNDKQAYCSAAYLKAE
jgi:uncharacterized protein YgiM (DUF1202 family)